MPVYGMPQAGGLTAGSPLSYTDFGRYTYYCAYIFGQDVPYITTVTVQA